MLVSELRISPLAAAMQPDGPTYGHPRVRGKPQPRRATLLHSLARNHALIDGNKRLALAGLIAFYGLNGRRLTLTNDEAYNLIMNVAAGHLDTVDDITAILQHATQPRD